MTHNTGLKQLRDQYFATRKIICTGNPEQEHTIASGIKKLFPDATFLSRSTGWDLANLDADKTQQLAEQFRAHNTFINASFIAPQVQTNLLEICNQAVKYYEVINIGSTHEYDELGPEVYKQSKISLRNKSLALNSFRFETHHLVLGGIKNDHSEHKQHWVTVDEICETIQWLLDQNRRIKIPMMVIDQPKQPW